MLEEVNKVVKGQIIYRTDWRGTNQRYTVVEILGEDFETGEQDLLLARLPSMSPRVMTTNFKLKEGGFEREEG